MTCAEAHPLGAWLRIRLFGQLPGPVQGRIARWTTPSYRLGVHVVLRDPAGRFLLVRQAYRASWGLPGGALRRYETYRQAAVRELNEEVGLLLDLAAADFTAVQAVRPRWVTWITSVGLTDEQAASVRARGPEITACHWFPDVGLPPLTTDIQRFLHLAGDTT